MAPANLGDQPHEAANVSGHHRDELEVLQEIGSAHVHEVHALEVPSCPAPIATFPGVMYLAGVRRAEARREGAIDIGASGPENAIVLEGVSVLRRL